MAAVRHYAYRLINLLQSWRSIQNCTFTPSQCVPRDVNQVLDVIVLVPEYFQVTIAKFYFITEPHEVKWRHIRVSFAPGTGSVPLSIFCSDLWQYRTVSSERPRPMSTAVVYCMK